MSANAQVRRQASAVLADTLLLRDPGAGEEGTRGCVRRNVDALISLMEDNVPSVRVAWSTTTARMMREP